MLKLKYEDLLNVPWAYNGNSLQGINCYNLVKLLQGRIGNELPDIEQESREEEDLDELVKNNVGEVVRINKPEPYCLVVFSVHPPYVTHIGVVLPEGKFIHIIKGEMVVVEKLNHLYWKNKIAGYYRCKKKKT